jgi:hypothetical protein
MTMCTDAALQEYNQVCRITNQRGGDTRHTTHEYFLLMQIQHK